jgi:cation diffusion facilitator family transporter
MTVRPVAHAERDRGVRRVLAGVLLLNLTVAATKFVVGFSVGAVALLADAVHSLLDSASNVVGLIGATMASRPPDRDHPYGHRRFETIASVAIGLLIAVGVGKLAVEAIDRLVFPAAASTPTWGAAAVVLGTVVVNLMISRYERRRGEALGSAILVADAGHTMSDALAASVVLASFAGTALGLSWADAAASLVVCAFIARTAWNVLSPNLGALADRAQLDRDDVRRVAEGVKGVLEVDAIRSRGSTGDVYVDLTVRMAPEISLDVAHDTAHEVITAIRQHFPQVRDVVVHVEPGSTPAEET